LDELPFERRLINRGQAEAEGSDPLSLVRRLLGLDQPAEAALDEVFRRMAGPDGDHGDEGNTKPGGEVSGQERDGSREPLGAGQDITPPEALPFSGEDLETGAGVPIPEGGGTAERTRDEQGLLWAMGL